MPDGDNITNSTSRAILNYEYFISSVLIIEFLMTIFSNVMLLLLIARSRKSPTTLNIFLFSLTLLDLLLSVNQLILLALIFMKNRPIPHQICHISFGLQEIGIYGIVLIHVVIGYNRYRTSKNPIHWESNLKKAWVTTGVIWMLMFLLATLESILHIGGLRGTLENCFWPRVDEHIPFKVSFQIAIFTIMVVTVGVTCYYHMKTINFLNENRKTLEKEMEMTSEIQYYEGGSSSPEKTARSLVVVFIIHTITLLTPLLYETIRIPMITAVWGVTGSTDDPSPTPLLLTVTTIGLFSALSPFFLIIVSQRFKANVTSLFRCNWKPLTYHHYNTTTNSKGATRIHDETKKIDTPPKVSAADISIFLGESTVEDKYKSKTVNRRLTKKINEGDIIVLTENAYLHSALGSQEEGEAYSDPRSGIDCRSAKSEAAVQSGLVLATASHNQALDDFFENDEVERQYQEALASAKALEELCM